MARSSSPSFVARARAILACMLIPAALAAQGGTGTLAGRVTAGGEAVSGATVVVTGMGRGTQTRSDGTYHLTLPAGRYEVRTRLIGFSSGRDSATIVAGQTTTLNFAVRRAVATLEAVTTLGTRGQERTVIDAPAPIDVLSAAEIKSTGRTETAQMIQAVAPSFNFPRTSIGDGTDHVRPATLRSLSPDQTLVLVNGKRRHNSALVNVNGFVGRGSAPVDLNALPSSMIDHIEILRDGAAAQYGSDAIAGEFRDRGYTNRSLADPRVQYAVGDPRESNPSLPSPEGRINHRQGDAATHDVQGFWNGGSALGSAEVYSFGGVSKRHGEAAGF